MSNNSTESSSSNDEGWIIAVSVVGVIIFIVVHVLLAVVIIMLWHRSRKRRDILRVSEKQQTFTSGIDIPVDKNGALAVPEDRNQTNCKAVVNIEQADIKLTVDKKQGDSKVVVDGKQAEVVVDQKQADSTKLDGTSSTCVALDSDGYESLRQIPLPVLRSTTTKDRLKLAREHYEAVEKTSDYEEALHTYANIPGIPDYSTVSEYEEASNSDNDEEVFIDPGHDAADMYTCFEKHMCCVINKSDINILQILGSGEFGIVHLGSWSNGSTDDVQVAVKTLNSQCSESDRVKFLREAAIMGQFEDDYIVRLFGVILEEQNVMIVLEYLSQGDLQDYLIDLKNNTSTEDLNKFKHDLLSFSRNVSAGFDHLARKNFVHRDLAARNILVSSDNVCKIADFGLARDVGDDTYYKITGGKIPIKWTAPEAIFYKKYSVQSDVWSFGCVMYEIWSLGHKPFENDHATVYLHKISNGYRLPPPPGCPRAVYELMIQCWHPVANQRIRPSEIFRTLQKSDRILMPEDAEERSTMLGDSLSTSSQLYLDLQKAYVETQ